VQTFGYLQRNSDPRAGEGYDHLRLSYAPPIEDLTMITADKIQDIPEMESQPDVQMRTHSIYFATTHIDQVLRNISPSVFRQYVDNQFVIYDHLELMDNESPDFPLIEKTMRLKKNIVYVSDPRALGPPEEPRAAVNPADKNQEIQPGDQIKVLEYTVNRMKIKTRFLSPKFLVFNDAFYPGWKVFVNGRYREIIRTNVAFKGLWVPVGESVIHFRYGDPWRFILGFLLMGISNFILITLVILWIKDSRNSQASKSSVKQAVV